MKCLLIETKDKRKFFTHEKNFPQLIEFSKTFNASLSIVKMNQGPVLELAELAPAICSPIYKKPTAQYEIVQNMMSKKDRPRTNILKLAEKIKLHIVEEFKGKRIVSLKELKKKFRKDNLSSATLCNHVRRVKNELETQGFRFEKVGAGQYRAV